MPHYVDQIFLRNPRKEILDRITCLLIDRSLGELSLLGLSFERLRSLAIMAVESVPRVIRPVMDDTTERVQIDTKASARTRNHSAWEMIPYTMNLIGQITMPMFRGLHQISRRLLLYLIYRWSSYRNNQDHRPICSR